MQDSEQRRVAGDHSTPAFTALADLASARVGGRALWTSDDFFASRSNLLRPSPPIFIPGKFTSRGKWMDGWESRRRRTPGHDWCVIRLGMRGRVLGIDVDTRFFTGNYPSHCSLDALDAPRAMTKALASRDGHPWITLLPKVALRGDTHNYFPIDGVSDVAQGVDRAWTHLRLNIYPDGGVARLRAYGEVAVNWRRAAAGARTLDLAAIGNGGLVLGASDMHFGTKDNLIMPGRAVNMGDGWETRRRRGPGHDWAIVRLGAPGLVRRVEIDTSHFKGNYPDTASLEGCFAPRADLDALQSAAWLEILPGVKLRAHRRHVFTTELRATGPASHVRLNIFPDGGISRLRIHGTVAHA